MGDVRIISLWDENIHVSGLSEMNITPPVFIMRRFHGVLEKNKASAAKARWMLCVKGDQ